MKSNKNTLTKYLLSNLKNYKYTVYHISSQRNFIQLSMFRWHENIINPFVISDDCFSPWGFGGKKELVLVQSLL